MNAERSTPAGLGPLHGLRVLDLTQLTSGPICTKMLAEAGAEVIKIEPPGGEPTRRMAPCLVGRDGTPEGVYFLRLALGKRSVVLDLKQAASHAAFLRLVDKADVLVENFKPGTMAKLGLGYDALHERNKRLVFVSVSGFGQLDVLPGPYSDRPSYDPLVQAMTGIAHATGSADGPPTIVGASIGDTVPGMLAAYATLLALQHRRLSGEGSHVDVAQYDTMLLANDRNINFYLLSGKDPPRGATLGWVPYDIYPAADGLVVICVANDTQWGGFCRALGREDLIEDERTAKAAARRANVVFVESLVVAWTTVRPRHEIVDSLLAAGVPAGPVATPMDIAEDPHAKARMMVREYNHPQLGRLRYLGSPVKISGIPEPDLAPPAALGEDTYAVLHDVAGMTDEEIAAVRS